MLSFTTQLLTQLENNSRKKLKKTPKFNVFSSVVNYKEMIDRDIEFLTQFGCDP